MLSDIVRLRWGVPIKCPALTNSPFYSYRRLFVQVSFLMLFTHIFCLYILTLTTLELQVCNFVLMVSTNQTTAFSAMECRIAGVNTTG